MTLQRRKQLALILLGISILAAIYAAIPGEKASPPPPGEATPPTNMLLVLVDELNRMQLVHFTGHLLIFGGVALLLGPWGRDDQRGSFRLALRYVIVGGLVMEAAQVTVGYSDDYITDLILGVSFDLMTDLAAGLLALLFLMRARYSVAISSK
jgi:hypothetical protein